jgi:hypothetical protein
VASTFGMGRDPAAAIRELAMMAGIAVVGWVPLAIRTWKRRFDPNFRALLSASRRGRLEEELGEFASVLEEAAKDLNQIEAVLGAGRGTRKMGELGTAVRKEAFFRMRRAFDLAVSPAFRYGLTREQAGVQIHADAAFLARARIELLHGIEMPADRSLDEILRELLRDAEAMQEARAGLRDSL